MKKWRRILLSALVALLLATLLMIEPFSSPAAHAGSNGQQIFFTISANSLGNYMCGQGQLQAVQITGTDQNGQNVTWSGSSPDGSSVFVQGWWWVGNVTVTYQENSMQKVLNTFIPQQAIDGQQDQDTAYVNCQGNRKWAENDIPIYGNDPACINLEYNPQGHYSGVERIFGYEYLGQNGQITSVSIDGSITITIVEIWQDYRYPSCDLP